MTERDVKSIAVARQEVGHAIDHLNNAVNALKSGNWDETSEDVAKQSRLLRTFIQPNGLFHWLESGTDASEAEESVPPDTSPQSNQAGKEPA